MADPELSSEMSYGKILAVFQDYADWDLQATPNPTRCRIYIKAGRMLLALSLRRSSQAQRHEEVEVEPEIVEREVNRARHWLATYNANQAHRQVIPAPDWRDE